MRTSRIPTVWPLVLAAVAAGCAGSGGPGKDAGPQAAASGAGADSAPCARLETRVANAPDRTPSFPGQTRACAITSNVAFEVVVLARGLVHPWAVEPLPGGDLLVTEKPGRLRIVSALGELGAPIGGLPDIDARGQGGLLDVALSPSVPEDNPFAGQRDARSEVWTIGHRNTQAAAFDPRGRLWVVEYGPQGGDEVNLIEKARNYGWPLLTYGEEYSGSPVPGAVTQREGLEQPVYYWDPVIAPSGAQWYTGEAFPQWRDDLFIGGMVAKALVRLEMTNDRVTGEEHLLADRGQRVRDVRQGPDGALYIVTDEDSGELWKIAPRP